MDVAIPQYLAGIGHLRLLLYRPSATNSSNMSDYVDSSRLYRQLSDAECAKVPIVDRISFANPVFDVYVFWSVALLAKMLATRAVLLWLTNKQVVARSADVAHCDSNNNTSSTGLDDRIGRWQRTLRNDAENILPLLFAGFFYVLSGPDERLAIRLFRLIAAGRLAHTVLYTAVILPQPARFAAFIVPFCATGFMAIKATLFFAFDCHLQQPQWARI